MRDGGACLYKQGRWLFRNNTRGQLLSSSCLSMCGNPYLHHTCKNTHPCVHTHIHTNELTYMHCKAFMFWGFGCISSVDWKKLMRKKYPEVVFISKSHWARLSINYLWKRASCASPSVTCHIRMSSEETKITSQKSRLPGPGDQWVEKSISQKTGKQLWSPVIPTSNSREPLIYCLSLWTCLYLSA